MKEAIRLEKLPVEISLLADGEKALAFILKAADNDDMAPDAFMLDLNLPRIDGMHILERLRSMERFRETPVVVVTSSDSPEDRKKVMACHAKYFRKPASYDEFVKIGAFLRRMLEESGLL